MIKGVSKHSEVKLRQAVLATVVYGEVFSYPLEFDQLYRGLISGRVYSKKAVEKAVEGLVKKGYLSTQDGFYFWSGQERLAKLRLKREVLAKKKKAVLEEIVPFFRFLPAVGGVYLTGSVAWGNASSKDDVDILVVTAPGGVWLGRIQMLLLLCLLNRRRHPDQSEVDSLICPNLFLAADKLRLGRKRQNLFTAKEIEAAELIWTRAQLGQEPLLRANRWTGSFLPHCSPPESQASCSGCGWSWPVLNRGALWLQKVYMRKRRTVEEVGLKRAFFHPHDASLEVKKEYFQRLEKHGVGKVAWEV
ncbi:nucleotidyltransferase domain-containing protein [Patescibacteria group bacterium]|nr:nucleotidyltransferase domain-containing protein [Patescibacteria group bacterium]